VRRQEIRDKSPPWPTEGYARVQPDEQGRFVVPAIAAGSLRIAAVVDENSPLRPKLPENITVEADKTTKLEIPMVPTVVVRGSIREKDTGKPIPGACITISYGIFRQYVIPVSDAQGRYTARVLPGRVSLHVTCMPSEYVLSHRGFRPYYDVPTDAKEFELPPMEAVPSLAGCVIDQRDQPVANVYIFLLEGNRCTGNGLSHRNGQLNVPYVPASINRANVKYQWKPKFDSTMLSECEVLKTDPLILRALPRDPRTDRP
jgi:hypothetical protein